MGQCVKAVIATVVHTLAGSDHVMLHVIVQHTVLIRAIGVSYGRPPTLTLLSPKPSKPFFLIDTKFCTIYYMSAISRAVPKSVAWRRPRTYAKYNSLYAFFCFFSASLGPRTARTESRTKSLEIRVSRACSPSAGPIDDLSSEGVETPKKRQTLPPKGQVPA